MTGPLAVTCSEWSSATSCCSARSCNTLRGLLNMTASCSYLRIELPYPEPDYVEEYAGFGD